MRCVAEGFAILTESYSRVAIAIRIHDKECPVTAKIYVLAVFIVVLSLQGCDGNPLEGKWKLKSGQDNFLCSLGCKEVIYGPGEMICDGAVIDVSYEFRDNLVILRQEDDKLLNQLMGDQAIQMIDQRTYSAAGGKCKWGKTI